jgi:hypothetical protein
MTGAHRAITYICVETALLLAGAVLAIVLVRWLV